MIEHIGFIFIGYTHTCRERGGETAQNKCKVMNLTEDGSWSICQAKQMEIRKTAKLYDYILISINLKLVSLVGSFGKILALGHQNPCYKSTKC